VRANQQRRPRRLQPGSKLAQLRGPGLFCGFQFKVNNLAPGLGGFGQHIQLCSQRAVKVPAKLLAPAGCNCRYVPVADEEFLQPRQGRRGFGKRVQPELQKLRVLQR